MPFIYYGVSHVSSTALRSSKPGPSGFKNGNVIPCVMWMKNLLCNDTLNEELDIDSDDEMDLEIEGETVSEESSNEIWKVKMRVKQVFCILMGGKTWHWATRNPRHTHLLKMKGHNLTFCQMQSPWTILVYFSLMS
jgi:hypothetical protein